MIGLGMAALKVYLAVEPCDMRQGFNGLTIAAIEHLGQPLAHDAAAQLFICKSFQDGFGG